MSDFDTISTETWRVLLPSDWAQRECSSEDSIYFEAANGIKGAYFSTWRFDEDPRSPIEILKAIWRVEVDSFAKMKNRKWQSVDEWSSEDANACILGVDYFDRQHSYRIACKLLANLPWVVRTSFHDYDCSDYAASKEFFRPIIDSVSIHHVVG